MGTNENNDTDPWLTIAEIAEQLRVNPATVRLWVSKGALPARRAGMRKLLVRRSDLDWMQQEIEDRKTRRQVEGLEPYADQPPKLTAGGYITTDNPGERAVEHDRVMFALRRLSLADEELAAAVAASENAPPDPGFPRRVRELAHGFMQQGDALTSVSLVGGISWTASRQPQRQHPISHELRPGGNRPGPSVLWDLFDRAVDEVAVARASGDIGDIAFKTRAVAWRLHDIADALGETADFA